MITVAHLEEYRSLHGWSLFSLLRTATVSSYMVTPSLQTQYNEHTMHEQPVHHRNDLLVDMVDRVDYMMTTGRIKPGS